MFRVTLPDGSRVPDHWLRVWRTTAYFLMTVAGVLLVFSPVMWRELGIIALIMSIFLMVGGFMAFLGAITERWAGEFMGIPLLSSSFFVFGLITSVSNLESAPFIAGANFALLVAVAATLLARWREVKAIYHVSHLLAREDYE